MKKFTYKVNLFNLLLIIMVDGLGLGVVLPIIHPILFSPEHAIVSAFTSQQTKILLYGLLLAIFPFSAMFGSAILGSLSDFYGRKKTLYLSLLGTGIANVITGLSISSKLIMLFALGRFINGLSFGNEAVSQAAIVDISSETQKPKNLSLIEIAICIGFSLGPLFCGVLSHFSNSQVSNLAAPFYAIAIFCFTNIILLAFFYTENKQGSNSSIPNINPLRGLIKISKNNTIRVICLAYFLMQLSWGGFIEFLPLQLYTKYHFAMHDISLVYILISASLAFALLYFVPQFLNSHNNIHAIQLGLCIQIFMLGIVNTDLPWHTNIWLCAAILPIGIAYAFVGFLTLFSETVSELDQGKIMGIANAIWSLSWTIISIVFVLIYRINYGFTSLALLVVLPLCSVFIISHFYSPSSEKLTN